MLDNSDDLMIQILKGSKYNILFNDSPYRFLSQQKIFYDQSECLFNATLNIIAIR